MSGGYNLKLVDVIPAQFVCPHCTRLMREPVQTMYGERACKSCYEILAGELSASSSSSVFLDKHAKREILQLRCRCDNEPRCDWIGTVFEHEEHVKDCTFVMMKCRFCGEEVVRHQLHHHQNNLCSRRTVLCEYCNAELPFTELKVHKMTCARVTVQCPFHCGESMFLHQVRTHVGHCINLINGNVCPYTVIGCHSYEDSQTSAENLLLHLRENVLSHSLDSVCEIFRLKQNVGELTDELKMITERCDNVERSCLQLEQEKIVLQNEVKKFKDEQTSTDVKWKEFNLKLKEVEDHISSKEFQSMDLENLDSEILQLQKKIEFIEENIETSNVKNDLQVVKSFEESFQKSERTIDKLESDFAFIDVTLSDVSMKVQLLEQVVYDGHQLWRLDNVKKRMQDAITGKLVALHSPPAYTKRGGYKFCCRLYPYGDGLGKGTHMSLFFVLMKSEFDELCVWPFTLRVSFRIIHPKDPALSHRETFIPDKQSSSFQKPGKDMNVAAGCPKFITIDQVQNQNFIIDDCLFFEVIVGPHPHGT